MTPLQTPFSLPPLPGSSPGRAGGGPHTPSLAFLRHQTGPPWARAGVGGAAERGGGGPAGDAAQVHAEQRALLLRDRRRHAPLPQCPPRGAALRRVRVERLAGRLAGRRRAARALPAPAAGAPTRTFCLLPGRPRCQALPEGAAALPRLQGQPARFNTREVVRNR